MDDLILRFIDSGWGYPGILAMIVVGGIGAPIPEDIPLITAGVLASYGGPNVAFAVAFCLTFIVGRDLLFFWLGRRYGLALLQSRWGRRIVPGPLVERMTARIQEHGVKVVAAGRFAVGVRTAIFFGAGVAGVPWRRFLLADGLAALLSVPLWVGLGWAFAENLDALLPIVRDLRMTIVVVLLAVVGVTLARWWRGRSRDAV